MPPNLFLVPFDTRNFHRTVVNPDFTGSDLPEEFPASWREAGTVRIWGVRDGKRNTSQYERMTEGDSLLFYNGGQYKFAGRVGKLFESNWIANQFWGYAPSKMLYTVDELQRINLPRSRLNDILDYKSDWYPQGFQRAADDRQRNLHSHYGSFSAFVEDFEADS